jgi:amidophosphoribosyltransferase
MLSGGVLEVFSPLNRNDLGTITYEGLRGIQNRGETAVGIAIGKDGPLESSIDHYRNPSKVREFLIPKLVKHINFSSPYIAIAHVHKGNVKEKDIEPIDIVEENYRISIGIDGKILRSEEIRRKLKDCKFDSNTDAELIGRLFGINYEETNDIWLAGKKTMETLNDRAAYCVTMLFSYDNETKGIVMRCQNGIKPLCYGKKDDLYMFSSQTTSLDLAGVEFEDYVTPGSMCVMSKSQKLEIRQLLPSTHHECIFEGIYYHHPSGMLPVLKSINPRGREQVLTIRNRLGRRLFEIDKEKPNQVELMKQNNFVLSFIPDSGKGGGEGYSYASGLPLIETAIKLLDSLRTFDMKVEQESERIKELLDKYVFLKDNINGKCLSIVDDSTVYGPTSRTLIAIYRKIGALEVHCKYTCAPKVAPCFTGFEDKRILAAEPYVGEDIRTIEKKVAEYIGADSVTYPTVEDNIECVGKPRNELCLACLTGEYPLPAAQEIWNKLKTRTNSLPLTTIPP